MTVPACDATSATEQLLAELAKGTWEQSGQAYIELESIGRLAGGVAHDFNNILTAILTQSALARRALPAASDGHRHLQSIVDATNRGVALTRQLLRFAHEQPASTAPPAVSQATFEAAAPRPPPQRTEGTVLLVEDDEMIRDVLKDFLCDHGFTVACAANGLEALAIASEQAIDLLLSDVVMPYMSGIEVAGRLRERQPGLPVVLMTGYSDRAAELPKKDDLRRIYRIDKPFEPEEVVQMLQKVLVQGLERP